MARQGRLKGNRKLSSIVALCLIVGVAGSVSKKASCESNSSSVHCSSNAPEKRLESLEQFEESCDFPRISARGLTPENFREFFVLAKRPVIIEDAMKGWPAAEEFRWNNLRDIFANISIRVGAGPYPSENMGIDEYLELAESKFTSEATVDLAEVPGIFQYGQVPTSWSLWNHKDECIPAVSYYLPHSEPIHHNFSTACELLTKVQVPEFVVGDESVSKPPNLVTHSGFLIGYAASGIDYHSHQTAINLIFEGKKVWYMKVSNRVVAGYSELEAQDEVELLEPAPSLEETYCSRFLDHDPVCKAHEEQTYLIKKFKSKAKPGEKLPKLEKNAELQSKFGAGAFASKIKAKKVTEELEDDSVVLHCVQKEGEIVFIPGMTQHAVQNLERTFAMQMQFADNNYKNQAMRDQLYRYLLHDLDYREPDPDFEPLDSTSAARSSVWSSSRAQKRV